VREVSKDASQGVNSPPNQPALAVPVTVPVITSPKPTQNAGFASRQGDTQPPAPLEKKPVQIIKMQPQQRAMEPVDAGIPPPIAQSKPATDQRVIQQQQSGLTSSDPSVNETQKAVRQGIAGKIGPGGLLGGTILTLVHV
jgi:hypothetical protein